jgi:hypothetical protein
LGKIGWGENENKADLAQLWLELGLRLNISITNAQIFSKHLLLALKQVKTSWAEQSHTRDFL